MNQYYQYDPPRANYTGDIWNSMVIPGLSIGREPSAIVITPACDLVNRKVDVLTLLPVLPIDEYLGCVAGMKLLNAHVRGIIPHELAKWDSSELFPPTEWHDRLDRYLQIERTKATKEARRIVLSQLQACSEAFSKMESGNILSTSELRDCFGAKSWPKLLSEIIENQPTRPDTYFLRPVAPNRDGLQRPSVALLRYPISLSVGIFDAASDPLLTQWTATVSRMTGKIQGIEFFAKSRPAKTTRLNRITALDLLNKFGSLFSRVGDAELSDTAVTRMRDLV